MVGLDWFTYESATGVKFRVVVLAWAKPDWLNANSPLALRVRIVITLTQIEVFFNLIDGKILTSFSFGRYLGTKSNSAHPIEMVVRAIVELSPVEEPTVQSAPFPPVRR